jgi:methionine--tRNA ligase beta chain
VAEAVLKAHDAGELPALESVDFEGEWKAWVKGLGKDLGRKGKDLFMPLRMVMTGRMAGPDLPAQLRLLGLAAGSVQVEYVPLDERMVALQREVATLEAAPKAPPPPPPAATEGPSPFDQMDIRVGKIVEAWEHPDSEKLWCERIDVGEEEPREIASGLRAYYGTAEEMTGRKVLVVCNLKPAKLAGFASSGMVLCASSADRSTVAFVEPPEGSEPGERVLCEGAQPVAPASPNAVKKKKLMEKSAEELRAVDTVATYRGTPLVTAAGKCISPSVSEGTIN